MTKDIFQESKKCFSKHFSENIRHLFVARLPIQVWSFRKFTNNYYKPLHTCLFDKSHYTNSKH